MEVQDRSESREEQTEFLAYCEDAPPSHAGNVSDTETRSAPPYRGRFISHAYCNITTYARVGDEDIVDTYQEIDRGVGAKVL